MRATANNLEASCDTHTQATFDGRGCAAQLIWDITFVLRALTPGVCTEVWKSRGGWAGVFRALDGTMQLRGLRCRCSAHTRNESRCTMRRAMWGS